MHPARAPYAAGEGQRARTARVRRKAGMLTPYRLHNNEGMMKKQVAPRGGMSRECWRPYAGHRARDLRYHLVADGPTRGPFLHKPLTVDALARAICQALDGVSARRPTLAHEARAGTGGLQPSLPCLLSPSVVCHPQMPLRD